VRNFGRTLEQRILAAIRVTFDTPSGTLRAIPQALEAIVRDQPTARFDRCHLKTLGDSALLFELSYFVQQPSVNSLLDLQQAVNFRIIDEFRRLGVEFDYPTQRVLLAQPRAGAET
jgi:small-conductance mechanosensitive channel